MALTPATTTKISDWYSRNAPKGGGMLDPVPPAYPAASTAPGEIVAPRMMTPTKPSGMLSPKLTTTPPTPLPPVYTAPSTLPPTPLPPVYTDPVKPPVINAPEINPMRLQPDGTFGHGTSTSPIAPAKAPSFVPSDSPRLDPPPETPPPPSASPPNIQTGMLSAANNKIVSKPNSQPTGPATPLPPGGSAPYIPPVGGEPYRPPGTPPPPSGNADSPPTVPPPGTPGIPDTSSMTMEQAMAAFQATPGNPLAGFSQQQILDGLRNVSHETFTAMTPLQRALAARVYALAGVPLPNAPLTSPQTLDPDSLTTRNVAGNETVAGQMKGLLDGDSEWIQSNRNKAVIEGNSRGMLNSTMSASAGQLAAINSALPIAQADAATYGKAADYNAALKNQAKMFNAEALNKFAGQQLDINANRETQIRDIASKATLAELSNETQRMVARLQAETSTNTANISANSSLARERAALVQGILNNPDIPMDRVQQMLTALGYPELARATQFREDLAPANQPGLTTELSQAIGNFQSSTGMLTGYSPAQVAAGLAAVDGSTLYGLQPSAFNQAVEVYWRAGVPLPAPPSGKPAYQYPASNPWGTFGGGITGAANTGTATPSVGPAGRPSVGAPEEDVNRWGGNAKGNGGVLSAPKGSAKELSHDEVQGDFSGGVDENGTRYHKFRNQAEGRNSIYNDTRRGPFWVNADGAIMWGKAPDGKTQYGAKPGKPPKPSPNPEYNQEGWVYSGTPGRLDSWTDDKGRSSPTGPGGQQVPDSLAARRAQGMFWRDTEGNAIRGVAPPGYRQWNAGFGSGTKTGSPE